MSGRPDHSSTADPTPEVVAGAATGPRPGMPGRGSRRRPHRSVVAVGLAVAAVATAATLVATSLGGGPATTVIHEPGGLTVREIPIGDDSAHLVATVTGPPPVPATAAVVAAVAASEGEFGLALTRRLMAETPGQNVIDSPLSADLALSMLELGAKGATRQGVARTLQAPSVSASELASAWARMEGGATSKAGGPLELADSAWLQRHVSFVPSYLAGLARSYGDNAYSADFADDNPGATAAISDRVTGLIVADAVVEDPAG